MKTWVALIGFIAAVAAHGYVDNATINGVYYQFYQPYQDPYTSPSPKRISRPIQGNGPVTDVTYQDLQCGGYTDGGIVGSSPAAEHAPAEAGSTVTLHWTLWPDSHIGPTITYMAKCPDTGCMAFMPNSSAVWFKIAEDGRDGTRYAYTIPSCLKPGYYLVRHEIIALHASYTYPGAQFYPGCHQLQVIGNGSTVPIDLVAFPGAYKGSDSGITYDAYKGTAYTVPGPKLFTC